MTLSPKSNAFTLIELLLVISIITLLVGLLLPSLSAARESARSTACASHLRQVGLAAQMYADHFDEQFLPHSDPRWTTLLREYYQIDELLTCPSDEPEPLNVYANELDNLPRSFIMNGFNDFSIVEAAREGELDPLGSGRAMLRSRILEHSDVILFGEKRTELIDHWVDLLEGVGNDLTVVEQSRHGGECRAGSSNYAFVDGSVRPLAFGESVSPVNLWGTTHWGRYGLAVSE